MYETVSGSREELNAKLARMREGGDYNIVGTSEIKDHPPYYKPEIRLVSISCNPEDGEVYPTDGGKYGFKGAALREFQRAGNVEFPKGSVKVSPGVDNPESVHAVVYGQMVDSSGYIRAEEDGAVVDPSATEARLRNEYEQKVNSEEQYKDKTAKERRFAVDERVKTAMMRLRSNPQNRAITIAKGRVTAKLLGLKGAYSLEQMSRPFVIIAMLPHLDYADPAIKLEISKQLLHIDTNLYPSSAGISQIAGRSVVAPAQTSLMQVDAFPSEDVQVEPSVEDVLEKVTVKTMESANGQLQNAVTTTVKPTDLTSGTRFVDSSKQQSVSRVLPFTDKATEVGFNDFPKVRRVEIVRKMMLKKGAVPDASITTLGDAQLTDMYNRLAV